VARHVAGRLWRVEPNIAPGQTTAVLKGLRRDAPVSRNRDMAWERLLEKKSAERLIAVDLRFAATADGFALSATDADGHRARVAVAHAHEAPKDAARAEATLREHLARLGGTLFDARQVVLDWGAQGQPCFVPASVANALRRDAVAALEAARAATWQPLPRADAVEPPVPYPEDTLSYLANVYNAQAAAFYARHGVKVIDAAYESHQELGEVSLMITRHCVRFSLSLCPKQAKGVQGVQGTVKAEPLTLVHGDERLTLRFDCKPCEMHVVGSMRKNVLQQARREERASLATPQPIRFYKSRAAAAAGSPT
jgi:putative protease